MGFESWGSVLAISIVRGAAERLAGLRVWEAFVFVFIEGKLTGVYSAHVTSCKISMLHAPWLPCWCFNSCKGWCANKMALLPFFYSRARLCSATRSAFPNTLGPFPMAVAGQVDSWDWFHFCCVFCSVLVCPFHLPVVFLWPLLLPPHPVVMSAHSLPGAVCTLAVTALGAPRTCGHLRGGAHCGWRKPGSFLLRCACLK